MRKTDLHTHTTVSDGTCSPTELVRRAHELGVEVHAGHGIQVANMAELNAVPHLTELNIGHTIVARAVFVGLAAAVREMRRAIDSYQW